MSLPLVGALTTVGTLLSLPVPILVGHLADRYHPRGLVVAGQVLQAAGFVGYLLARDLAAVCLVVATVEVGQRMFWSSFFTMIAALPVGDRGSRGHDRRFALVGMLQNAGYGIGALVAGALVVTASTGVYLLAAALNAVTFLASAVLLLLPTAGAATSVPGRDERRAQQPAGYRMLLSDRPYLLLIMANTAFAVCAVFLSVGLPVYIVDGLHAPGWIAGVVPAVNTVLLSVAQLAATRLVRPLSRVRALAPAGALWTVWGAADRRRRRRPGGLAGRLSHRDRRAVQRRRTDPRAGLERAGRRGRPGAGTGQLLGRIPVRFHDRHRGRTRGLRRPVRRRPGPALPWIVVAAVAAAGAVIMPMLRIRIPAPPSEHSREARRPGGADRAPF